MKKEIAVKARRYVMNKNKKKKPNNRTNVKKQSSLFQGVGLTEKRTYEQNLMALKKVNPNLAGLLEQTPLNNEFQFERTGPHKVPNLYIPHLNTHYYSPTAPLEDVEQQIIECKLKNTRMALFLGIGLGYELAHYLKKVSIQQKTEHILVVERNLEVFKYALCVTDLTKAFNHPNIIFKVGVKEEDFFVNFVDFLKPTARMKYIKAVKAVYHMTALKLAKSYYLQTLKSLREAGVYQLTFYGDSPEDSIIGVENMLKNVKEIVENPGINLLYNKFKGKPAIVVSTGPSLNKNKHLLKDIEDKALIICPDASLRILIDMGVKPHLVTSLERIPEVVKLMEGFAENEVENVYFAACPVVVKETYEAYPGPRVIVYRDFHHFKWLNIDRGILDIKHSSGNMAFKLGEALGCDPIILIGQDLAYSSDGTTHASGTFYGEVQGNPKKTTEVMGNNGEPILTNETWNLFRQSYEVDIAKYNGTCINSTEGGAYINGTKVIPFQEAINNHVQDSFNPLEQIRNHLQVFSKDVAKKDVERVRIVIDETFLDLKGMVYECSSGLALHNKYKFELADYISGVRSIEGSKPQLLRIQKELMAPRNTLRTKYQKTFQLLLMHIVQSFYINFEIAMNEIPERHESEETAMADVLIRQDKWYYVMDNIIRICIKLILDAKVELCGEQALSKDQEKLLEEINERKQPEPESTSFE